MWEFPSVEHADSYDAAGFGLTEIVGALGFSLSLQPVIVKELTHVFSHRKWFMKAFRGDLQYTWRPYINRNDTNAITEGLDAYQTGGIRRLCLGGTSW